MKKYLWKLATCACIGLLCTGYTSCDPDPNPTITTEIDVPIPISIGKSKVDSLAGSFKLKNITDSNQESSNEIIAIPGDTIQVIFEPKSEYRTNGIHFVLSCSGLEPLSANNDSMYVVNRNSNYGKLQISLRAKYENKSNEGTTTLSASTISTINVQSKSYIAIPYQLQVSEDLLQFVTPEITYNDPLGNKRTYRLENDDMVHSDSVTYSYTHNGKVENQTYLPNAKYSFKLRYTSLPATTEVTVRYIPKDNVEITRNDYDFQHRFDRMSASGILYDTNGSATIITDIYSNFSITINPNSPKRQTEQGIRQYIETLARTPDVKQWSISTRGKIEEVKE